MAVTLALRPARPLLRQLSSWPLPQLRLYIQLSCSGAPRDPAPAKLAVGG